MPDRRALTAEIGAECDAEAVRLSEAAECLLAAANRLRAGSIQAHGEAAGLVDLAERAISGTADRIRHHALRWREVKDV